MAIVRDRLHALLLERGPMTTVAAAAALDASRSMIANAGRELVAAGRCAPHEDHGAPWVAIPPPEEPTREGWEPTTKLSAAKLDHLRERLWGLPLSQQALAIEGSPFDEARIQAMARALRAYPDAARAVAIALREIT